MKKHPTRPYLASSHHSLRSFLQLAAVLGAIFVAGFAVAGEQGAAANAELETATFAMYCYWTGEATLGRVDGVEASRIGHWAGREIVQVDFDPAKTGVDQLVRALKKQRSFDALVLPAGESTRGNSSQVVEATGSPHFIEAKHSLRTRHPQLWALGLDESQAMALNSWSYFGGPMPEVLTEDQLRALNR